MGEKSNKKRTGKQGKDRTNKLALGAENKTKSLDKVRQSCMY